MRFYRITRYGVRRARGVVVYATAERGEVPDEVTQEIVNGTSRKITIEVISQADYVRATRAD